MSNVCGGSLRVSTILHWGSNWILLFSIYGDLTDLYRYWTNKMRYCVLCTLNSPHHSPHSKASIQIFTADWFTYFFGSFLFSIFFFYIYIYWRKFNAEFNKFIKTVGHYTRFFQKWCWTHPPLPTILTLFGYFIFSLIKSLSGNKTLKMLGL